MVRVGQFELAVLVGGKPLAELTTGAGETYVETQFNTPVSYKVTVKEVRLAAPRAVRARAAVRTPRARGQGRSLALAARADGPLRRGVHAAVARHALYAAHHEPHGRPGSSGAGVRRVFSTVP